MCSLIDTNIYYGTCLMNTIYIIIKKLAAIKISIYC